MLKLHKAAPSKLKVPGVARSSAKRECPGGARGRKLVILKEGRFSDYIIKNSTAFDDARARLALELKSFDCLKNILINPNLKLNLLNISYYLISRYQDIF